MCPIAPNALWALDFQFDTTADNRTLKLLNIVDEFTRECPAIVVERSIDADLVVATLDRLGLERGAPAFVRFDNGPEFIAHAVADWCRFNGVGTIFIDPGSPWQNAWIESLQRPPTRRAAQRLALRQPARSQSAHRGLADRLEVQDVGVECGVQFKGVRCSRDNVELGARPNGGGHLLGLRRWHEHVLG